MSGSKDRHDDDDDASPIFSHTTETNSRILFIAIIVLSTVVVVVTMLHIYTRYVLRRQARRRVAFQGIGLMARIHSEEPPKKQGLEPDVIASIPILMYKNIDHGKESQDHECAVCLSSFEDGQMIRALPNCKHHFHAECIDKWLGSQTSCPICRHEVEVGPTILPLPREPSIGLVGGDGASPPSAPPLEQTVFVAPTKEGTSDGMVQSTSKLSGTSSRLGSFRRMISMDRSSRRNNSCTQEGIEDLERQ